MVTNENKVESYNNEEIRRRKLVRNVIICVVVYICVIIAYKCFSFYIQKITQDTFIQNYQKEITSYLEDRYGEEFHIEFVRKGNKAKRISIDATDIYFGREKNIEGYLYTYSPKNSSDKIYYITYWYNKKTGNSEISEIRDGRQIALPKDISLPKDIPYYPNDIRNLEW